MEEISSATYRTLKIHLGEGRAKEIAEQVHNGELTSEEADEWADRVVDSYERSKRRRDIDPEEWNGFEDGWRPEDW